TLPSRSFSGRRPQLSGIVVSITGGLLFGSHDHFVVGAGDDRYGRSHLSDLVHGGLIGLNRVRHEESDVSIAHSGSTINLVEEFSRPLALIETAAPIDDARSSDRFNLFDSRMVAGNKPLDRTMTSIAIIMRTEPVYGVQVLGCRRVILTDEFIDCRNQLSPGGDSRARQIARLEQQPSLLGVCHAVVEVMHDRSACG